MPLAVLCCAVDMCSDHGQSRYPLLTGLATCYLLVPTYYLLNLSCLIAAWLRPAYGYKAAANAFPPQWG